MAIPLPSLSRFKALQFHIHTFSEHEIVDQGGRGFFPAELHIVHQEEIDDASFAVFGSMIDVGTVEHDFSSGSFEDGKMLHVKSLNPARNLSPHPRSFRSKLLLHAKLVMSSLTWITM
jgi:hypothetical protein